MNPFNKNPFAKTNQNTHIVGNNIQFDEKKKLENIRENMNKLKFKNPNETVPVEDTQLNVKERIDNLKNIDRWK